MSDPQYIGRYRIVRPLGEGGMGRVLLAEVAGAGGFARRVVLKLVRDELDEALKQALLDEARVTATLVHRNIVPVLATGAGHDSGVLAEAGVATAMLFVRNPTGISHSPEEFADRDDCLAGVAALTKVVAALIA